MRRWWVYLRILAAPLLCSLSVSGARADVQDYHQTLRISEFMAVNDSGLKDVDGDYSDWIEIHNPTPAAINLGGWYLTDTVTNKTLWRFPATNLNAGAFLVVFASDKNRASAGAQLHTNFKLSGSGEYLGLVMPDGATVASEYAPLFPPQLANISCGLTPVTGSAVVLVASNSPARVLVPSGPVNDGWQLGAYQPDASWAVTPMPAGYEVVSNLTGANILFVVATNASAAAKAGDTAVLDRLTQVLGHQVTVTHDSAAQTSDASGRQLVIVSSSAVSGNVNTKFRDVAVPVINWDRSLVDDFGIGAVAASTTSSSNVVITPAGSGHPAVGGFSAGTRVIRNTATGMSVASNAGLAPGAQVLATANSLPAVILVEPGQLLLNNQSAPARRIHMLWGDEGLTGVNAAGLELFDAAVAYALSGSSSGLVYAHLIATDTRTAMQGSNSTLLARLPFALPEAFSPSSLTLRLRYDDGFVAWLNGVEIARRNAPGSLAWNAAATTSRLNLAVLLPEVLDVSAHLGLLTASDNVLAIQGLNASAADPDFFLEAGLSGSLGVVGVLSFYATPTPGNANMGGSLGLVPPVVFSHDRGYVTNAFVLTLSNGLSGAEIRFTTNGTPPTASSGFVYTAPFTISNTTVIRAAAYKPGYLGTNVATMSYLFLESILVQPASIPGWPQPVLNLGGSGTAVHDYGMDPRVVSDAVYASEMRPAMLDLPAMCLTVKQSDMWDANGAGGFYRGATEAPVSVELIYPGQPTNNVQADASVEGHSHDRLKRTLRLTFRASTGASRFDSLLFEGAPLFGDTAVKKVNSIVLRGGNNRCWARNWNPDKTTYTEDSFYRATQIALSGVGSHGAFVHLYINGLYWGIYEPVERPDNAFAASYLGGDDDDWFSINHGGSTNGLRTRWDYLTGALAAKDMAEAANYAELQGYLNVTNFIDYLLTCWYIRQNDWPGNNWWAACRNTPPGPASFFAWDGEWWFGSAPTTQTNNTSRAAVHGNFVSSVSSHSSTIPKLWHVARKNADFMMLCADRAFRHTRTNGALNDAKAIERWNTLSNALHVPILAESARWGDSISAATLRTRNGVWNNEQTHIGGMLAGNAASLMASLRDNGYYPTLAPPEFNHPGGLVSLPFSFALTHANGSGDIYFTVDGSDPRLSGGAVNPAAVLYAGAIPLRQSTLVQARVLDGSTWSALNDVAFAVPGSITLQPTELMYHAADPTPAEVAMGFTNDTFFEFVELKNTGSNTVALAGVRLTDGVNFDFPATNLPPGQILLLIRNQAGFESRYGDNLPVWGVYAGGLDNDGDTLRMRDAANQIVFNFRFEDHWQTNTDGGGHSLVPTVLSWPPPEPATNSSWRASVNPGGSPGLDEPAALGGFQAWKLRYFTLAERNDLAISGPEANPDGDRWPNFTEYAFVTDPRTSGGELLPTARVEGGLLKVVFRRLKSPSDVSYRLEIATELDGEWRDAGNEAVLQVVGSDETSETVEAIFQTPVPSRTVLYLRIVALPIGLAPIQGATHHSAAALNNGRNGKDT